MANDTDSLGKVFSDIKDTQDDDSILSEDDYKALAESRLEKKIGRLTSLVDLKNIINA